MKSQTVRVKKTMEEISFFYPFRGVLNITYKRIALKMREIYNDNSRFYF